MENFAVIIPWVYYRRCLWNIPKTKIKHEQIGTNCLALRHSCRQRPTFTKSRLQTGAEFLHRRRKSLAPTPAEFWSARQAEKWRQQGWWLYCYRRPRKTLQSEMFHDCFHALCILFFELSVYVCARSYPNICEHGILRTACWNFTTLILQLRCYWRQKCAD